MTAHHTHPHSHARGSQLRRAAAPGLALLASAALSIAPAPAQAAAQWLPPQTLSLPGLDASEQQLTVDPAGDATVVWQGAEAPHAVILASSRPAGGAFGVPQVLTDPGAYAAQPDVASDARGDAVAVWLKAEGSSRRVQAAYRPAGGAFGAVQTLSQAGAEADEPRVAMDGRGDAVLLWSIAGGGHAEVQAAVAAPGGAFAAPVSLSGPAAVASVPQVALDEHGDAIAVWDGWDGSNIRIEDSVRPAGASFGAPQLLSPAGYNADTPQLAYDAAGDALVVWRFDGPPASTVQGALRPAGGEFGGVQQVSAPSSEPAQDPQVAFDGEGHGVVAWQQSDGSELRIDASVRAPAETGTFGAQSTLDAGGQEAYEPRVAGDGLSGTLVSWETFNGMNSSAQVAARPDGAGFAPAVTVSASGALEGAPEVAVDAQGNALAVWSRFSGTDYLLEAADYSGADETLGGGSTVAPAPTSSAPPTASGSAQTAGTTTDHGKHRHHRRRHHGRRHTSRRGHRAAHGHGRSRHPRHGR